MDKCVLICPSLVPCTWLFGILPLEGALGWSSWPDPLFHKWKNLKFRGDGDLLGTVLRLQPGPSGGLFWWWCWW